MGSGGESFKDAKAADDDDDDDGVEAFKDVPEEEEVEDGDEDEMVLAVGGNRGNQGKKAVAAAVGPSGSRSDAGEPSTSGRGKRDLWPQEGYYDMSKR